MLTGSLICDNLDDNRTRDRDYARVIVTGDEVLDAVLRRRDEGGCPEVT